MIKSDKFSDGLNLGNKVIKYSNNNTINNTKVIFLV